MIEIGPVAARGFAAAVAEAYEAGLRINFEGLFAGETRRRISLPDYPFERRRYWIPTPQPQQPVVKLPKHSMPADTLRLPGDRERRQ